MSGRSRSARSPVASAWPSGMSFCAARRRWARRRGSAARRRYAPCAVLELKGGLRARREQRASKLCEARARTLRRDIAGQGADARGKIPDVGHADGIGKECEHRRVIGGIAHEYEALPLAV